MDNRFSAPYSHPRWWFEGSYTPSCFDCAHFRGAQKGKMVCLAFPDGIPEDVLWEPVEKECNNGMKFIKE